MAEDIATKKSVVYTKSHKLVIDTASATKSNWLVIDIAGAITSHRLVIDTAGATDLLLTPSSHRLSGYT